MFNSRKMILKEIESKYFNKDFDIEVNDKENNINFYFYEEDYITLTINLYEKETYVKNNILMFFYFKNCIESAKEEIKLNGYPENFSEFLYPEGLIKRLFIEIDKYINDLIEQKNSIEVESESDAKIVNLIQNEIDSFNRVLKFWKENNLYNTQE